MEEEKITIIEGPPPVFEEVTEGWVLGLNESLLLGDIALTRLRTFNGPALVERCHRAWHNNLTINLEYRSSDGLEQKVPIVAARTLETPDGFLLVLWVRVLKEELEVELGYDDDEGDEDNQDSNEQT